MRAIKQPPTNGLTVASVMFALLLEPDKFTEFFLSNRVPLAWRKTLAVGWMLIFGRVRIPKFVVIIVQCHRRMFLVSDEQTVQ
jgi:hypothetical protein